MKMSRDFKLVFLSKLLRVNKLFVNIYKKYLGWIWINRVFICD